MGDENEQESNLTGSNTGSRAEQVDSNVTSIISVQNSHLTVSGLGQSEANQSTLSAQGSTPTDGFGSIISIQNPSSTGSDVGNKNSNASTLSVQNPSSASSDTGQNIRSATSVQSALPLGLQAPSSQSGTIESIISSQLAARKSAQSPLLLGLQAPSSQSGTIESIKSSQLTTRNSSTVRPKTGTTGSLLGSSKNAKQSKEQAFKTSVEERREQIAKPKPGSSEHKLSSLDWKVNRKNIVSAMIKVTSAKEVQADENGMKDLGEYLITQRKVAQTYSSTIYECKTDHGDVELVAKLIDMNKIDEQFRKHIKKYTFSVLWFVQKSSFRYIACVYDIFLMNKSKLVIIEERLDYPLALIVAGVGRIKIKEARGYIEGLANALFFLYKTGIAHQNVCAWNVFITPDKIVKLGGMEYATIYYDPNTDEVMMQKAKGKLPLQGATAPEVYTADAYDPTLADVYSFGAVMCFMIVGHYPKDSQKQEDERKQLETTLQEIKDTKSQGLTALVTICLKPNPKDRPSIRDVVGHSWFSEAM